MNGMDFTLIGVILVQFSLLWHRIGKLEAKVKRLIYKGKEG